MIHLAELRQRADNYEFRAAHVLARMHGNMVHTWLEVLDRVRRDPQGEDRQGIELLWVRKLAIEGSIQDWAVVTRFLWLCDQLWENECRQYAQSYAA